MDNTEILTRIARYAQDTVDAAHAANNTSPSEYTRYTLERAQAALDVITLEVRWSKGEIVFSDEQEAKELTGDCRG